MATKPGERRLQSCKHWPKCWKPRRGERSPPPPGSKTGMLRSSTLSPLRQQGADVRGLIEFIEQSLFSVINQITSEESKVSSRSN